MSTEKLTQLVDIVVEPSLQNPDHFPQVECRPTSRTVLPLDSNSFSFVLYINFIKIVFFFWLSCPENVLLGLNCY